MMLCTPQYINLVVDYENNMARIEILGSPDDVARNRQTIFLTRNIAEIIHRGLERFLAHEPPKTEEEPK